MRVGVGRAGIETTDTPLLRTRTAKAGFAELVLVCAKCAKRQALPKRAVRGMLKQVYKRRARRAKLRVVETGCLGPCPKQAIAVATAASLATGRVLLLDPAATPDQALDAILPEIAAPISAPKRR